MLVSFPTSAAAIPVVPAPLTPAIGREREAAAIRDLLESAVRLVTLTGPAGVGKTRLALQVAEEVAADFPDGVWFVPLATVREPGLVPSAIAHALGMHEATHQSLSEAITAFLRGRDALLILDNFEHLLSSAPLVTELLSGCPGLRCMATSRALLQVSGEHAFPVPPLPVPPTARSTSAERANRSPAVRLFVMRAKAARPDFELADADAAAVETICRRLDGLPLALELAAARVRHLTTIELASRLMGKEQGAALRVLTGGPRDAPDRQQTLHYAIAWSFDLLAPAEQTLFRRLGVFAGGCTLEAAEAVATAAGEAEIDVSEGLAALIDQSLLRQQEGSSGTSRYGMLETIREFALEQLHAHGELEAMQRRHADYFLAITEAAEAKLRGREQVAQLAQLESEHDNLRAALTWSLAAPDCADVALRLVGALYWFWYLHGHFSEGRQWLEEALARPVAENHAPARGKALVGAGILAYHQDDYSAARARLEESIAIGRERQDPTLLAYALHFLAMGGLFHTDHSTLRALVAESVALFREVGDRWGLAMSLRGLGMVDIVAERYDEAGAPLAESLALFRELGDTWGLARALHYSGELARYRGEDEQARALYEESLTLYHELGHRFSAAIVIHNLGYMAQHEGDARRGLAYFAEALAEHVKSGDRQNAAHCLGGIAGMASLLGQPKSAARLFGAADTLFASTGTSIWPVDKVDYDRNLATVHARLGEETFAAAFAAGQTLSLAQAVAEAVAITEVIGIGSEESARTSVHSVPAAAADYGLTPRELDVLRLLAAGRSDREIAEGLFISYRTASKHVSNILAKLEVGSRGEAAVVALRHGLV